MAFSKTIKTVLLFAVMLLSACSSKGMYQVLQPKYGEIECRKAYQTEFEYEECLKQQAKSYEEYEQERRELLEQEKRKQRRLSN